MSFSRGRVPKQKGKKKVSGSLIHKLGYNSIDEFNQENKSVLYEKASSNDIEFKEDKITGVYDETLNIRKLHNVIVEKLKKIDEVEIEQIEEEKANLKEKLETTADYLNYREVVKIAEDIEKCNQKVRDIKDNKILSSYLDTVKNILGEFDKIVASSPRESNVVLAKIVDDFVRITNFGFFDLSLIKKQKQHRDVCSVCESSLSGVSPDEGYRVCGVCGKIQKDIMSFYKNDAKTEYEDVKQESVENIKNYRKALLNFDLRADVKHLPPDQEIIAELDDYFSQYNPACHRDNVKNNGYDRWIRLGTNIYEMELAMKDRNFNKFYDNIAYFCKIYWDWKRPGIAHLEENLIEDFKKSRSSYNTHKGSRNSSINANYELYYALKRYGFKCKFNDLKMIKTKSTLDEYDEIRIKVENDMGWNTVKPDA